MPLACEWLIFYKPSTSAANSETQKTVGYKRKKRYNPYVFTFKTLSKPVELPYQSSNPENLNSPQNPNL